VGKEKSSKVRMDITMKVPKGHEDYSLPKLSKMAADQAIKMFS
jgi:hypothetical protein